MCLAIPGKIISINNLTDTVFRTGKVSFDGILKDVNLSMVSEAETGDYVLVHAGVAISRIDEEEAKLTLNYLQLTGGLADLLDAAMRAQKTKPPHLALGYPEEIVPHGSISDIEDLYGLSPAKIAKRIGQALARSGHGL